MQVVVVSGIWPPDVGGPATHASELAAYLHDQGHAVEVVTTAGRPPAPAPFPIRWVSRAAAPGVRHLRAAGAVARAARAADVVYATGMIGRSGLAALAARRPLVIRLVADPAYERARRLGLTTEGLDDFARERGIRVALLRAARDLPLRRAVRVVCPSAFLADRAAGWGLSRERIAVVPSSVSVPPLDDRDELRRRHGFEGPTLVFVGRFVPQKSLDVALDAVASTDGVSLVLVGDGPERPRVEELARRHGLGDRARFVGSRARQDVFELLRAADASLLSSSWENFPHTVVEALAVGTPVIATAVGGVPEVVEDERNGLLVQPQDTRALAAAIVRFFASDGALGERLRAGAAGFAAAHGPLATLRTLEQLLREAAGTGRAALS
ncbi:MAG TPA: glycosyltransferase family 4 protein [Gaiellaceae bacterium]|nr:glycosyltransferase family 4 protein [Gaiellaceae bacterium]